MNASICLVLSTLCLGASAYTAHDCPSNLLRRGNIKVYGNKCYQFEHYRWKTFPEAQKFCQRFGGSLASVKSDELNKFLVRHLDVTLDVRNEYVWIGLRYNSSAHRFSWMDGEEKIFSNFEEKPSVDTCVALNSRSGKWKKFPCEDEDYLYKAKLFICEYPLSRDAITRVPPIIQPGRTVDLCPEGLARDHHLKLYQDKCYYFSKVVKTYEKADEHCEKDGGRLATAKSKEVNDFLWGEMVDTHHRHRNLFWLGLRFDEMVDALVWSDGDRLDYSNYYIKSHSGMKYGCVGVNSKDGTWTNFKCNKVLSDSGGLQLWFVCEYKVKYTPTPSTKARPPTTTTILTKMTTTTAPVTTTTPTRASTTTTTTPATTATSTTVSTTSTTTMATTTTTTIKCPAWTCELDCWLYGYAVDPVTKCTRCECDSNYTGVEEQEEE